MQRQEKTLLGNGFLILFVITVFFVLIGLSSRLRKDNLETMYTLHAIYANISSGEFESQNEIDKFSSLLSSSFPGESGDELAKLVSETIESISAYAMSDIADEKRILIELIKNDLDELIICYKNIIDYRDEVLDVFLTFLILAIILQSVGFFLSLRRMLMAQMRVRENERRLVFLQEMRERERQDLASYLHDRVLQDVAEICLSVKEELVRSRLQACIDRIRGVTYSLVPVHMEQIGLEGALKELGGQMFSGQKTHFKINGYGFDENVLSSEVKLIYYRFFQEALNNCRKHSGADRVNVSLTCLNGRFAGMVQDNGNGFARKKRRADGSGGMGLYMLEILADRIDGLLEIESELDRGTRIKLTYNMEEGGESDPNRTDR